MTTVRGVWRSCVGGARLSPAADTCRTETRNGRRYGGVEQARCDGVAGREGLTVEHTRLQRVSAQATLATDGPVSDNLRLESRVGGLLPWPTQMSPRG